MGPSGPNVLLETRIEQSLHLPNTVPACLTPRAIGVFILFNAPPPSPLPPFVLDVPFLVWRFSAHRASAEACSKLTARFHHEGGGRGDRRTREACLTECGPVKWGCKPSRSVHGATAGGGSLSQVHVNCCVDTRKDQQY